VKLELFAIEIKKLNQKNKMESKGLGDTIEKFTTATGIKKIADKIPGGCGCKARKEALNRMFPYNNVEDK
jgi:hypothetical protein